MCRWGKVRLLFGSWTNKASEAAYALAQSQTLAGFGRMRNSQNEPFGALDLFYYC